MSIRDDRRLAALTAIAVVSLLALLVLAAVFIANAKSTKADAPGLRAATEYPGGSVPAPTMRLEDAASGRMFDTASLKGRPYMVTFLYTYGVTRMQVGLGSAVGVVLFVICITLAFGYKRIFMRHD